MRCAYTGGALVALARVLNITAPEIIIAGSGSAGFSLYYLTEQYDSIRRIATELLSTPKFISFLRPLKIMDIDYLIDVVFKKQEPLDIEKLSNVKTKYYIPIKGVSDGNLRYISNLDNLDIFETLRATTAIPFFYNKKVNIEKKLYIDGSSSSSLKKMIDKAIGLGATKVLVIDSRTIQSGIGTYTEGQVFLLCNPIGSSRLLTRNSKRLTSVYEKGYADVARSAKLQAWLQS